LVVLGADNQRIHEEVIFAGGEVRAGRFIRIDRVGELERLASAGLPQPAPAWFRESIEALWESHFEGLRRGLEARVRDRTKTLQNRLDERADVEVAAMRTAISELIANIRAQLHDVQPQMELFTTPEREQIERDRSALERRLDELPMEMEQEEGRIRERYASPLARLFPVSVTYLVPQGLTHP
jgi:hypothetical protein